MNDKKEKWKVILCWKNSEKSSKKNVYMQIVMMIYLHIERLMKIIIESVINLKMI